MVTEPARYPPLPEELQQGSRLRWLKFFGPGAIIASVTVGSGETVFASRGGAVFGYTLLWCFVASALFKGIQVYSGSRFMVLTGRHPLESWAEMPGPRGWFVWMLAFLTIIWMPFWLGGGLPLMLGDFTNWVVGFRAEPSVLSAMDEAGRALYEAHLKMWARLWATLFIVMAVALTLAQSYGFLERVQTVIVGLLLFCMVVAAAFTHPDLAAIVKGTLVPTRPRFEKWLLDAYPKDFRDRNPWVEMVVYFGVIGGGTQDYFGYLGLLREKAWGMLGGSHGNEQAPPTGICEEPENRARGRLWLRAPLADVGASFACVLVFTICFLILGATVLHPNHVVPAGINLLVEQARFLIDLQPQGAARTLLGFIYKTGIFFAFFGTIYGAYELYTWTTRECLVAAIPSLRHVPIRRFRIATLLWCGLGGLALLWGLNKPPVVIITPAALVGSSLTCGIWCFAILWSDRKHVPAALRMGAVLKAALVLSGTVLCVVPAIGIYKYVLGLMG
jgi:hypothetical protein